MGGEFGGEWIRVYVWLSPFAVHLKPSPTLLISYAPTQNLKKKFVLKSSDGAGSRRQMPQSSILAVGVGWG